VRALALPIALLAVLLGAVSARAETAIYVAEQPGLSITFRVEGRHVFVTSLTATGYCRGTGGHSGEFTETTSRSFLGPPQELDRAGSRLRYLEKVTETFYVLTRIDGEIGPGAITGSYLHESSSPVEGDGGCQTGSPAGDPRVHFEAVRYVPFESAPQAPDPAAEAIYFLASRPIEMYVWVGEEGVTDVRGRVLRTCIRPGHPVQRYRTSFGIEPPVAVSDLDGSFYGRWGFQSDAIGSSTQFAGTVADDAVTGWLSETNKERRRGRVAERCHTGRGDRGWVPYRATRYVPVGGS
jgi:hypothetical protein